MLKKRIVKIAKSLQKFELDDIITLAECDEQEALEIIESLILEQEITKIGKNDFKYSGKNQVSGVKVVDLAKIKVHSNNRILFKFASYDFLINYAQQKCTPSTLKSYKSLIKIHLNPYFGNFYLKDITSNDIRDFIERKQRERISNKTINNCVTLLGNMLRRFIEKGYIKISPYNKIINVSFPKQRKVRVLTQQEIKRLVAEAEMKHKNHYTMILLALATGLKRGEILGLKVKDIDLQNRKININQTVCEGNIIIPKAKSVIRSLEIPDIAFNALKGLIINKTPEQFLLWNQAKSDTLIRKDFYEIAKISGLCGLKFNELRHTYAYFMLQAGASIEYLHKQLGDYSIQATMDKYRDFIPKKDFQEKMLLCLNL